jgi:hypothetical protein
MKYSGKVLRDEQASPGSKSTKNQYAVSNVNQKQGPRMGNASAHEGKRTAFTAAKEERAPLADMIAKAYGARTPDDKVEKKLEPISANTKAKFKSKK